MLAENHDSNRWPGSLIAALVLAALVPAVSVLWFMSVAMRNERLAVQERMIDVYSNQLTSLQQQAAAFWKERTGTLQATTAPSPAARFAAVVGAGLADAVVVFDSSGKPAYPAAADVPTSSDRTAGWAAAQELEFQRKDFPAAAAAYARIAESADTIHTKARALLAEAGALLKTGDKSAALIRLSQVAGDPTLRNAVSPQGFAIAPNAQLLILRTVPEVGPALRAGLSSGGERASNPGRLGEPAPPSLRERTLAALVSRLNNYSDASLPAAQRRFLMREVKAIAPGTDFPTLAAEDLAADYLEANAASPAGTKLQRTPLPRVWQLATANRSLVALFREEQLKADLEKLLAATALPNVRVTVLAPDEPFAGSKLLPPRDAGEFLPGWRLALTFNGDNPLATASARQTRFYLWAGLLVVVVIALLAWLVARTVNAQMRLARLKNELVSTVSHELKTPLASMRALVDTLAAGHYRDERQLREYLDLIAKENVRLSELIENFLTFSRQERGKQQFRFEPLEPARVVDEAVGALKEKLGAAHCSFAQQIEPGLPRIRGDANALSTVLINLLDNAYKYTEAEKRISARAYAQNGHVCFEVADNGIGFDRNEAKRIFDRFYQVDQSLTRQRGGCGLGLGIVQYIIRAHHGAVQVESEPGKGSTFRVTIPVDVNAQPATLDV